MSEHAEAVKLYESGLSLRQVAAKLSRSHQWVKDALVAAGKGLRPRSLPRDGTLRRKLQARVAAATDDWLRARSAAEGVGMGELIDRLVQTYGGRNKKEKSSR